jgi:hypothetical protein
MLFRIGAICVALAAYPAAAQQADSFAQRTSPVGLSISTGVDYSTGDYGLPQNTNITVVPFSVRATSGDFAFTASVPYLRLNGPSGIVVGSDGQPLPGVPTAGGSRHGLGDLNIGANYTVRNEGLNGFELAFGGRVKLPTSSDRRQLSTGKTDVSLSGEVSYATGDIVPFANVGYRFLGDPAAFDLRSGPTASVGISAALGAPVLIVSYDYARASSHLINDSHEIFGGVSVPVTSRVSLTGYGVAGLSSGSPDFGAGMLLTFKVF